MAVGSAGRHARAGGRAPAAATLATPQAPTLPPACPPAPCAQLNFGLHHSPASSATYASNLRELAEYVTANRSRLPRTLWISTSPQHWDTRSYATGECGMGPGQALGRGNRERLPGDSTLQDA